MAVADRDRIATNGHRAAPKRGARAAGAAADDEAALERIQQRILWLATRMIHEANHVRPNRDGLKVGGHQASSASMVSILTAIYLRWLRAGDLVAVKPHSSPRVPRAAVPAGRARSRAAHAAPVVRRPPVVPVPDEGPRPHRLLDRLRRAGRRRADVRGPRRPLPPTPLPRDGRASARAAVRRHGGRRRARRRQRLGGDPRGLAGWPGQCDRGRRPQPSEPRSGRARDPHPACRGDVRRRRLACPRGEVRATPPARVRGSGWPRPQATHRRHGERGIPGPHPAPWRGGARAAPRGLRRSPARRSRPGARRHHRRRPADPPRRPRRA